MQTTEDERRIAGYLGNDMTAPDTWPIETIRWLIAIEREEGGRALHHEIMVFIRRGRGVGRDGGYHWVPSKYRVEGGPVFERAAALTGTALIGSIMDRFARNGVTSPPGGVIEP